MDIKFVISVQCEILYEMSQSDIIGKSSAIVLKFVICIDCEVYKVSGDT